MLHHARLVEGGAESFTPLDIVREHLRTGDRQALSLWHEYEAATYGKSSIRFTDGLRERLLPHETAGADGELNTLSAGTETIQFTAPFYRKLARIPGLERAVLGALDAGGMPALNELLAAHQLREEGYQQLFLDL